MKHFMILFMAASLLISCKDSTKSNREKENERREKDDYRSKDDKDADNKNTDYTSDKEANTVNDTKNSGGNWSSSDVNEFVSSCENSAVKEGMERSTAKTYCNCMQQKLEQMYPDSKDAAALSDADMESIVTRIAPACVSGKSNTDNSGTAGSGWPEAEKESFISNCVSSAVAKGTSKRVATGYCDCMLSKMERLFPDIQDAAKLTSADMESPAMKKMASDCLNEN